MRENSTVTAEGHLDFTQMGRILGSLLAVAKIQQLVVVDDTYLKPEIDLEAIVVSAQIAPSRYAGLIPALETVEEDEGERISGIVRGALENGDVAKHAWEIYQPKAQDAGDDAKPMSVLEELFRAIPRETGIRCFQLSSSEWVAQADTILDSANGGALVLVDRDFSREGRGTEHGLTVVAGILGGGTEGVYCALLSHTITPSEELVRWGELAEEHGIPPHRFVVISKTRLGDADLAGFLHLLRLAVLCGPLQELRDKAKVLFKEALDTTHAALELWSVFDFDEAIFGSSRGEGVWEGETLLRVMSTFTVREARERVLGNQDVRKLIDLARCASSVLIPFDELHPWKSVGQMALAYQRAEYYFDRTYINTPHLPLEAGDVFERPGHNDRYILLAQPCELMVRGAGGRAYDAGKMVPLCLIKDEPASDESQSYELPCWHEKGESGYVHFSRIHYVRVSMLDLCVLREDGEAIFDKTVALPETLTESWREYGKKLLKQLKTESEDVAKLTSYFEEPKNKVPGDIRKLAVAKVQPCCSNTSRFKYTATENGFTVNLKRVSRVTSLLATDILRGFARHQSRTAFDQPVVTERLRRRMAAAPVEAATVAAPLEALTAEAASAQATPVAMQVEGAPVAMR